MRRLNDYIIQFDFRPQEIEQMPPRRGAEHHIDIRHAEVGVDDEHAIPLITQSNRQIDGDVGLSDTALPAGDRNDAHIRPCLRLSRREDRSFRRCLRRSGRRLRLRGGRLSLGTDHLSQPRCLICHIIPSKAVPPAAPPSPE